MAEITIHFRGICTHLVNGSRQPPKPPEKPQNPPQDVGLKPIHGWHPQFRTFIPSWDALPPFLKEPAPDGIPRHFPRLRYREGDLKAPAEWTPKYADDGFWEVDLQGVAIWFSDVADNVPTIPAAQSLHALPSVWTKTLEWNKGVSPQPNPAVINDYRNPKTAALVDFFGGQSLLIYDEPRFSNQLKAAFHLRDGQKPLLMWRANGAAVLQAEIRPGATIQISNSATAQAPCCTRDYLLHYLATTLEFDENNVPKWPEPLKPSEPLKATESTPMPDSAFCGSGTYP